MHLKKLTISNWACHERLQIDLSSSLQIEGRNGAGKSSILEAIRFAFAGSAIGYKSKIRNGTRQASVILEFTKEGRLYVCEKTLHLEKTSKAQLMCDSTVIADNPSSVHEALQNVLSENILEKLLYIPQGGLTNIVDRLKQKGGKQEIDSLFGLDRLERVWQGTADKIKEHKIRLQVIKEQMAKYSDNFLEESEFNISKSEASIVELNNGIENLRAKSEEISAKISQIQSRIAQINETKALIDSAREQIAKFNVSETEIRKDLESVLKDISQISGKKNELVKLTQEADSLKKYIPLRQLVVDLKTIADRIVEIGKLDEAKDELEKMNYTLAKEDELKKEFKSNETLLKDLEAEVTRCTHDLNQQKDYLESLAGLGEAGKCPRCGQKISEAHLFQERQMSDHNVKKLKSRFANIGAKLDGIRKVVGESKSVLESLKEVEVNAKNLRKSIKDKTNELAELVSKATEIQGRLSVAGYEGESSEDIDEKIGRFNGFQGKINLLESEVSSEDKSRKAKKDFSAKLDKIISEKAESHRRISELKYDEGELSKLSEEKDTILVEKSNIVSEVTQYEFQIKEHETKINELKNTINQYSAVSQKNVEVERKTKLLIRARDVFHTDKGLPKMLRDRYITSLGEMLTYFFKRINQNPIYRDVNFDKDYNIILRTTGGLLSLDQLSGGEKVQLAVAFRIALIEMLSPMRLLILDEPFGSLDADHREVLGQALNKMGEQWQLILVTHIPVDSLYLQSYALDGY